MKFLAIEGLQQSTEKPSDSGEVEVSCQDQYALKRYPFACLVSNQSKQMDLYNEWVIMRVAPKNDCKHIIHLTSAAIGIDHLIIKMPRFHMSFREYLWEHRDPRDLPTILSHIALGLKELH